MYSKQHNKSFKTHYILILKFWFYMTHASESEMLSCTVSGVAEEDYHYVGSEE